MECGSLLALFFFLDVLQTLTQLVLPKHLFWNLPSTKCKFHKSFVLIFMQIGGVYPPRMILRVAAREQVAHIPSETCRGFFAENNRKRAEWSAHELGFRSLFTKYLQPTTDDYLSSRISLSFAADKSSIFLVSAWEIF